MCFGGGGEGYNAFKGGPKSDFRKFENLFNAWANKDLAKARQGIDLSKLNNTDIWNKNVDAMSKDYRARMEAQELYRQHAIDLGKVVIDNNFAKFKPEYYDQYKKDYTGYYTPQISDQFNQTTDKLTGTLADRGMLESSVGNDAQAKLYKDYVQANTNMTNEAQDAANKLRSTVQQQKSNLYSLNESSADPMGVNAQAIGASTALVAPPTYSPLGQLFTSALTPFLNYSQAAGNTPVRTYSSPYNTNGSGKVVY